jgi:hypothetical protein
MIMFSLDFHAKLMYLVYVALMYIFPFPGHLGINTSVRSTSFFHRHKNTPICYVGCLELI